MQYLVGSAHQDPEVGHARAGRRGGRDTEVAAHRAVLVGRDEGCEPAKVIAQNQSVKPGLCARGTGSGKGRSC